MDFDKSVHQVECPTVSTINCNLKRGWRCTSIYRPLSYPFRSLRISIWIRAMDIRYTWIYWQGKICRQFSLLIWTSFIGYFINPIGEERMRYRGWMWGIVISSSCEYYYIRVYENLAQHPSYNIPNVIGGSVGNFETRIT